MNLSDSFPEYSARGDYFFDEELSTSESETGMCDMCMCDMYTCEMYICEMCGKEVADSDLSRREGLIRINGVLLCRGCFEHSTVESICDITDTPVDYIAECISD